MDSSLLKIIQLNNIDEKLLEEALYQDIREMFLRQICEYMKASKENYIAVRKIYYNTTDNILASKKIVQMVCNSTLPERDLKWIDMCIRAYFHKKRIRKPVKNDIKIKLWENQNARCAICKKPITIDESHVDHIVPWDYVGDELSDNYQILCSECNEHKSNHVAGTVHNLFFGKKGVYA